MGVNCTHLFLKYTSPVDLEIKKKDRLLKWFRKYHKWPGLIFALFILLFSVSGIILNHRDLFSSVDNYRKWIPGSYHYKNWNLAAVKSVVSLPDDSLLVFGNIGIWKTNTGFTGFRDFNKGFPNGIDNRKIYSFISFKKWFKRSIRSITDNLSISTSNSFFDYV